MSHYVKYHIGKHRCVAPPRQRKVSKTLPRPLQQTVNQWQVFIHDSKQLKWGQTKMKKLRF
jgi:hypothetical protein